MTTALGRHAPGECVSSLSQPGKQVAARPPRLAKASGMAVSRPICAVLLTPASRTLVGTQKLRAIHSCRRSFPFP